MYGVYNGVYDEVYNGVYGLCDGISSAVHELSSLFLVVLWEDRGYRGDRGRRGRGIVAGAVEFVVDAAVEIALGVYAVYVVDAVHVSVLFSLLSAIALVVLLVVLPTAIPLLAPVVPVPRPITINR